MNVKLPNIILELTEQEARYLGFALHEYVWQQARKYKENHPEKGLEDFKQMYTPQDYESNDLLELWRKLARFWEQKGTDSFEELLESKVFNNKKV